MKKSLKHKVAFTLAEILIVIGIIGVVAGLTIPTLKGKSNKAQLRASLNVGYSILSQAITKMKVDEGPYFVKTYQPVADSFKPAFEQYFKVIKSCNPNCIPIGANSTLYDNIYPSGRMSTSLFSDGQFVISNGMSIFIHNTPTDSYFPEIIVTIDVNGYEKKPNVWGLDTFSFILMDDGRLIPADNSSSAEYGTRCSLTVHSSIWNGLACTAKALSSDSYWENMPR